MFSKKETDSEKEVELLSTLFDFLMEAIGDDMDATSYGEEEAKKSIVKKTKALKALEGYDIDGYKPDVEKGVYRVSKGMSTAIRNYLLAFMAEDKATLHGAASPYQVELLIRDARKAEAELKAFLPPFKVAVNEAEERYMKQHNGERPGEDASIRAKL